MKSTVSCSDFIQCQRLYDCKTHNFAVTVVDSLTGKLHLGLHARLTNGAATAHPCLDT